MIKFFAVFLSAVASFAVGWFAVGAFRSTNSRADTLLQLGYKNVVFLESPIRGDCSYFRAISPTGCVTQGAVCDDGGVR